MKTVDRTLLTLVLAIAIALGWSWFSRTGWAASVSVLGVGQNFENALQPIIKVAAAIIVMVAATQLVQKVHGFAKAHIVGHRAERSHKSIRAPSS